jgi:hypothetical protein
MAKASMTALELQLCTLEDEDFWVDSGRFDVAWPEHAAA